MPNEVEGIVGIPEPWGTLLHQHQLASALPHQWVGIEATTDQAVAEASEKGVPNYSRTVAAFVAGACDFAQWLDENGWTVTKHE